MDSGPMELGQSSRSEALAFFDWWDFPTDRYSNQRRGNTMSDDNETDLLGSREPANNGYGQNGYTGPSSDLPGKRTRIKGFQPDTFVPKSNDQLRPVSNVQKVATTFGNKN